MKEYDGDLIFATDTWTLQNQKVMVVFMVHFEHNGAPMSMVLNVLKLAVSHSGLNLADAFAKMLEDMGLGMKVLLCTLNMRG